MSGGRGKVVSSLQHQPHYWNHRLVSMRQITLKLKQCHLGDLTIHPQATCQMVKVGKHHNPLTSWTRFQEVTPLSQGFTKTHTNSIIFLQTQESPTHTDTAKDRKNYRDDTASDSFPAFP